MDAIKKNAITVEHFYNEMKDPLKLEIVAGQQGLSRTIKVAELNRPGLAFAGYFDYFASKRIQVIGKVELFYLNNMTPRLRQVRIRDLFQQQIPCVIISRRYKPLKELVDYANKYEVPLLRSPLITMTLLNRATLFLENAFAPTISVIGDLMEVFGIGVMIRGKSGVGKSECALGLIKKGHRLVADDSFKIKREDNMTLLGHGKKLTRHHMEIRGIGIINVQTLFGAGCVRESKRIDLVIDLEPWQPDKEYERLGIEDNTVTILGVHLPRIEIPVKPGRDMVMLVETACLNHRLKLGGYHAAKDFNTELLAVMKTSNEAAENDAP